jgi:putative transposase
VYTHEFHLAALATSFRHSRWLDQRQTTGGDRVPAYREPGAQGKLGKKRILLDDDQRRRLAVKAKVLGRKVLEEIGTLFTPDTILRWHRLLVAQKWDHSDKRANVGWPATPQEVVDLILRFPKRIRAGATTGSPTPWPTSGTRYPTKRHGIEPAPDRKRTMTWSTFLKAHWDQLAAIDFTTVEVWTKNGLVTFYLLFAMRLATRQVRFLGCTPNPVSSWMAQMARNLTDAFDGFLRAPVRYVLLDRDAKFTAEFHHGERAHQGLGHRILQAGPEVGQKTGVIACRERLGGVLKYYHRQAA